MDGTTILDDRDPISVEEIRLRSYLIWEREGKPEGKSLEHWGRAEAELRGERHGDPKAGGIRVGGKALCFWDYNG